MNFKDEYKKSAEELNPSPEAMARMKANVLNSINAAPQKKTFPFKRVAVIGGSVAACLAITFAAVKLLPSMSSLETGAVSSMAAAEDCCSDAPSMNMAENAADNSSSYSDGAGNATDSETLFSPNKQTDGTKPEAEAEDNSLTQGTSGSMPAATNNAANEQFGDDIVDSVFSSESVDIQYPDNEGMSSEEEYEEDFPTCDAAAEETCEIAVDETECFEECTYETLPAEEAPPAEEPASPEEEYSNRRIEFSEDYTEITVKTTDTRKYKLIPDAVLPAEGLSPKQLYSMGQQKLYSFYEIAQPDSSTVYSVFQTDESGAEAYLGSYCAEHNEITFSEDFSQCFINGTTYSFAPFDGNVYGEIITSDMYNPESGTYLEVHKLDGRITIGRSSVVPILYTTGAYYEEFPIIEFSANRGSCTISYPEGFRYQKATAGVYTLTDSSGGIPDFDGETMNCCILRAADGSFYKAEYSDTSICLCFTALSEDEDIFEYIGVYDIAE